MFDHVTIRVSDREASRRFYNTVFGALGQPHSQAGPDFDEWNDFGLNQADAQHPVTRGLHAGFVARSTDEVDSFWRVGVEAGYASDGEPGLRPEYHDSYYGGFLLDPDGNSIEAVYHGRLREGNNIVDHLWIRVAELDAAKRFYETVAPPLGLDVRKSDRAERFHVAARDRSFALLPGTPTTNVHLAFPLPTDSGVDEFHRVALAAGYGDGGSPGERRQYHDGYYGAFVLDPDGNNIEAVNHNRG